MRDAQCFDSTAGNSARHEFNNERTLVHDSAKYIDSTWGGGTVPAAIPELVLALS